MRASRKIRVAMLTLPVFSILAVTTLVTAFISGILGMAGGMILMGVLLALLSVPDAMMLHGVTQAASNGSRAWFLGDHIDWRVVRGYLLGGLLVFAALAFVRLVLDKAVALIVLGLMPFLAFALPPGLALDVQRRGHAFACGLVCMGLMLTAGVSGPILDSFFARSAMTRHAVVATKAFSQTASHILKVAYFGGIAAAGGVHPIAAAILIALTFVGTHLSRSVLEKISDAAFRAWTRRTIMAIGLCYLTLGVRELL